MLPQDASTLPAVVDALLATWRAALEVAALDVDVFDGPLGATTPASNDVLVVGLEPPTTSAEGTQEPHGMGNRLTEHFVIHSRVSSLSGDVDMKPRRDRAYAILAVLNGALKANPTLGGVCNRVFLGPELQLWQGQTPAGAVAEVSFDVSVQALL